MYETFFGLKQKPFQLLPDPEFLFLSGVHKRALTYLRYGIQEHFGFILVTGEIGAGKTTIVRSMISQLPRQVKIARVYNTKVSSDQLISMIGEDFGLDVANKNKTELLSELTNFLIRLYAEGKSAAIIIDEAQNLSADLLEEIRLLSNLETDKTKLLQIILVGQPELNDTLRKPALEQLRQRIAFSTHINPLSREDMEAYIYHRLQVAGNRDCVAFARGVMDYIYEFSNGVPRLVNILCEFTFLSAFTDCRKNIDVALIREIISDLQHERRLSVVEKGKNDELLKEASLAEIRKMFSAFNARLRDLEVLTAHLKRPNMSGFDDKRIDGIKGVTQFNKEENELLRKRRELIEEEEILKKKEENVRSLLHRVGEVTAVRQ